MEELEEEMEKSSSLLSEYDFNSKIFAYPNGNFSLKSEKILKRYMVDVAFLFDHKINKENLEYHRKHFYNLTQS